MINITDARAKRRAWDLFDKMLKRYEIILYRRAHAYILRQYQRVAAKLNKGDYDYYHLINQEENLLRNILVNLYKRIAITFGTMILRENEKQKDVSTRTLFWNHILRWINEKVGRKVVGINNTTRNRIRRIVRIGIEEGLSYREIALRLTLIGKISSIKRAKNIAWTETHTTANKGSLEMARDIKMKYKEWLSAKDERTRKDHRLANGQRVEIDEPFIVMGESLQFPGDPDGSPENVIRCRCTMIYRDDKGES
jgi:SPP1 gp7 family putative phage head morphogenesis protein